MGLTASPLSLRESHSVPRSAAAAQQGAQVEWLRSVDGMVVYDLPAAPVSGGGTRLAADITEAEMRLLARAMTYKLAVLGLPVGGAKIGLRASPTDRAAVVERYRVEIAPRLASGALMTGPDLGTSEDDFAGLPTPGGAEGVAASSRNGIPVEELLTGCGVVSALAAALGGDLDGRTVALEGFGEMGASIARELALRGGRIVAVSTIAGCAIARPGDSFSIERLLEARRDWGDDLVHQLGEIPSPRSALWSVRCDALVPGTRPGTLDERTAAEVRASVIVPVADAPYTAGGLETLKTAGVIAHGDFVASAGSAMTYLSPRVSGARDVDEARAAIDELMRSIVEETLESPDGPYAGAVARADEFLRGWLPEPELPDAPPLA